MSIIVRTADDQTEALKSTTYHQLETVSYPQALQINDCPVNLPIVDGRVLIQEVSCRPCAIMPTVRPRPDIKITTDVFRELCVSIENLEELPDN